MSPSPKSLEVGKRYPMETAHIPCVVPVMLDGRIHYEHRTGHVLPRDWKAGI